VAGRHESLRTNVRLITGTNKDLDGGTKIDRENVQLIIKVFAKFILGHCLFPVVDRFRSSEVYLPVVIHAHTEDFSPVHAAMIGKNYQVVTDTSTLRDQMDPTVY